MNKNKKSLLILGIGVGILTIGVILLLVLPSKKTYIVTFDSSGGSVVESQKVEEGNNAKEPTSPTKEKYTFVEWTKDGKSFNFNTLIESDITLVANWKKTTPDEFEITIDPKNGEEVKQVKVLENEKLEKPEDPKNKGYIFKGWIIDGKEYDFDKEVTESFILVASWEKEKAKYTITFDSNGGSKVAEQKIEEGELVIKPENPTKEDNTFVEWQLNGKAFDFESEVTSNIKLKAKWKAIEYVAYKMDGIHYTCHEAGTTNTPSALKPGDKIECALTYEVYADDAISTLSIDLKYGKGLKLIDTKNVDNAKVKNGKYKFTYSKPMSVGSPVTFTFEVLDAFDTATSDNYKIQIDNIKFVTSKGSHYSQKTIENKYTSIWEKMNSSYVYKNGGFTLNCVDKDNKPVVSGVNGDIITCEAYLEVADGDEVKYLRYDFSFGSSMETVKVEIDKEITDVGGEYHYIANTPSKKINLGKKTFKVVNENNPHMMMIDVSGHFITADGRVFTPDIKSINLKNGNNANQKKFKETALNIINKAREDLVSTNKLEAGFYYIITGDTKKSPLGGDIKYYTSSCTKIGSTLCKREATSECSAASRSHIEVVENEGKFEYRVCLTAGGDYAYINAFEKDLLNNDDYSMIHFYS